VWGHSTVSRLLRNEAYIGRVYYNRTESTPVTSRTGRRSTVQRSRPDEEWIAIAVPAIVADETFEAAQRVSRDNSKWSPRNVRQQAWLLRGLVKCGHCGVGVNCHQMRGRNGTVHRYYWCRNHDTVRSRGEHRRCPERNIRADTLDTFVFDQVRAALLRPEALLAGEAAVAAHQPAPDDELLAAELARLDRKRAAADAERRRLADLYQTDLLDLGELKRRVRDLDARRAQLADRQAALVAQRRELATDNRLRHRVTNFARSVADAIDTVDFDGRQQLMRLIIEEVRVTGSQVTIQLRIPLDEPPPDNPQAGPGPPRRPTPRDPLSSKDGLRSLRGPRRRVLPATPKATSRRSRR
jgi:site-specific DNA recombinase